MGMIQGGMLAGRTVDLTFYQNGVARGIAGTIILDVNWQLDGQSVSVTHLDAVPPAAGCPVDQVGVYNLAFSGDCANVVCSSVSDPCEHRRRTLDGLQGRRQ